ncbi:unnamed protein product [Allacma fusca]|uniref:BCCIP family protein n=1 Tax=Allacma fusca TaxID=39272 RepID=A0A8J2LLP8_9HEXA|nr:unnamed protein product [Allacma fusca]
MGNSDDAGQAEKSGAKKHRLENNDQQNGEEGQAAADASAGKQDPTDPKKPRRDDPVDNSSDDESDDDDSDSSEMDLGENSMDEDDMEEGDIPENLIVDFEGVPPVEEDVGTVEGLLAQVYRGLPVNTLNLARLIVLNDHISTLLKDQDPDDPSTYAVSSVVNLSQPATGICTEIALQFRELVAQGIQGIQKEQGNKDILEMLSQFSGAGNNLSGKTVGLVVIEKLVNIPSPAVWQLLTTLKEDIGFENMHYTHFLIVTKMYRVGEEVFPFEEYYEPFKTLSSLQIDYALPKDVDTIPHNGQVGIPFRRLLVIGATPFYQIIEANAS